MLNIIEVVPKPSVNLNAGKNSQIDLDVIIEQIWADLEGTASHSVITELVNEVFPRYANARIKTYIPIFLSKEVRRRLLLGSM